MRKSFEWITSKITSRCRAGIPWILYTERIDWFATTTEHETYKSWVIYEHIRLLIFAVILYSILKTVETRAVLELPFIFKVILDLMFEKEK